MNHVIVGIHFQTLKLVEPEEAMVELGVKQHQIRFTSSVCLENDHSVSKTTDLIFKVLKRLRRFFSQSSHQQTQLYPKGLQRLCSISVLPTLPIHSQTFIHLAISETSTLLVHNNKTAMG